MKIHLIAIGGAAMHNIALDLSHQGHVVTGSDDEIYQPSLGRLQAAGICPEFMGWFPEKIKPDLDMVILGMHAKADNPELIMAQKLGLKVVSYPEFIYLQSVDKKRIVVAGSHGKTTTTAMILFVLSKCGLDFDFLVGAQLEGFDRMVKLTNAPMIVMEGDEYLSSPIDRIPKIHHYKPHIAVITGIAWDHINVFPTFESYKNQFSIFINTMEAGGTLIYNQADPILHEIVSDSGYPNILPYSSLHVNAQKNVVYNKQEFPISVIGHHNLQNLNAAMLVCKSLGINEIDFLTAIREFKGASKRLQLISKDQNRSIFLDFAHAPSKVKATTEALKAWFGRKKLIAVLELHTFSSLNKEFIPHYRSSLDAADEAIVFYNEHTLKMKNMPDLSDEFIISAFHHKNMRVMKDEKELHHYIQSNHFKLYNILLMTSGNFNQMSLNF